MKYVYTYICIGVYVYNMRTKRPSSRLTNYCKILVKDLTFTYLENGVYFYSVLLSNKHSDDK